MKKILVVAFFAGTTMFIACGPSAKEKAEKVRQDSIKKADSIAIVVKSNQNRYLGNWINNRNDKIKITKAGETAYTVKFVQHPDEFGLAMANTATATYENGNLMYMGSVLLSYSEGKIIKDGNTYEKSE